VPGCGGVFGTRMCHSHEPGAEPFPETPSAPVPIEYASTEVPKRLYERFRREYGNMLQQSHIIRMCQIAMEEGSTAATCIITADIERLRSAQRERVAAHDYYGAAEYDTIIRHLDNLLPRLRGESTKSDL
jgi:hypothetical protein